MSMMSFKRSAPAMLLASALMMAPVVLHTVPALANTSNTPSMDVHSAQSMPMSQKLKFYSKLYPQFFNAGYQQQVAYQGPAATAPSQATKGNPGVVKLLIASFNGETDFHALRQVLHYTPSAASSVAVTPVQPAVMTATKTTSQAMVAKTTAMLKSQQDLMVLLNRYGLTWQDYEALTDEVAHNPSVFEAFFKELDGEMVQNQLVARAQTDPGFVSHVGHAGHQQILKQMMSRLMEKPSKVSMR